LVPSIYSVSPTDGLTDGRNVLTVDGFGFRLYEPPASGVLGLGQIGWVKTVDVLVDGSSADSVAPVSTSQLLVVAPQYRGDPDALPVSVDVTVRNLDDDGQPIAGEEYTAPGAYTYRRPDLTVVSSELWVTKQLVLYLRRHVIANVGIGASPDYSEAPALQVTFVGELPAIVLDGPRCEENRFYRNTEIRTEDAATGKTRKTAAFTGDLVFGMLLVGRTKSEALNLRNAVIRHFHRRPYFNLPDGPTAPNDIAFRLAVEGEWSPRDNFQNQTFAFENDLRIEGVEFDDAYGLASDGVPIDDFVTDETLDDDTYLDLTLEETP
jgi:hypothetical protein